MFVLYSNIIFEILFVLLENILFCSYLPYCILTLCAELDALEADMGMENEADGVPSYLQPDQESDLDGELNLPSAPTGQAATPAGRSNGQVYANSVCNHFYALKYLLDDLNTYCIG